MYAVIFIDAINVKIREGQVANRPIYLALGVTADGERDVLGLWAGEHGDGEGAKYWLRVLSEIKNRGVRDVCMLVCDGLKGLRDAVSAGGRRLSCKHALCICCGIHSSTRRRGTGRRSRKTSSLFTRQRLSLRRGPVRRFLREVGEALRGYHPAVGKRVGGIRPFLRFDGEIRTVICTTNAIESINAGLRRAVNARGHFPTEQAALKCLYLAIMSLDPTGKGR